MRAIGRLMSLAVLVAVFSGCVSAGKYNAGKDYYRSLAYQSRKELSESLFKADQAVLSNEDIEKILTAKVTLPQKARMAILRYGEQQQRLWWSEEFAHMDQQIMADFIGKLRASKRLADVSVLPAMLTPKEMTVPYLREAAARLQANLMLVYRTESQTYQKYHMFAKDETRAYCTVEAVLLHTKTGIVSFTSIVTEDYTAKKSEEDLDFSETIMKAEREAIGKALAEVADDLVKFLDAVP